MRRRHLLALCAAGVSGCLGLGSGGGSGGSGGSGGLDSPTPSPSPTPTEPSTPTLTPLRRESTQRRPLPPDLYPLREVTVDLLPEEVPFEHGAQIRPELNDNGNVVPRLTVRVRNRSTVTQELRTPSPGLAGQRFPFPKSEIPGPGPNAIALRRRFRDAADRCAGKLSPTPEPTPEPTPLPPFATQTETPTPTASPSPTPEPTPTTLARELAPGETVGRTFRMFNHPDNDGCFPRGRYRAVQPYVAVSEEERTRYRWGFTIDVLPE